MRSPLVCDRVRWPAIQRMVVAMAGVLAAVILIGVTALPAAPSAAMARPAVAAAHAYRHAADPVNVSAATRAPRRGQKQGTVAVVFSVIGFIVLIVLVFALGSLSARRRVRDRPAPKSSEPEDSGEPGGGGETPHSPGGTSG